MNNNEFNLEPKEYFSLMIVPPSGKGTVRIRVTSAWLVGILAFSVFFILVVLGGAFYAANTSTNITDYQELKQTTKVQDEKIKEFDVEINALKNSLKDIIDREGALRTIIGGKKKKGINKGKRRANIRQFQKDYNKLVSVEQNEETRIRSLLEFFKEEIVKVESRMLRISKKVQQYKKKFAATPSLWPIYGKIRSPYGWRIHPKTGRMQFHKGVDVPSWVGAPVKASADGVVEYTGWGGGYGWLIIIGHDYGYRSMYAHLSEILVSLGQQIRKGQLVGKIGESGFTTGPHLHYEIRRWRRSIMPTTYLGLDLFTAVTEVW